MRSGFTGIGGWLKNSFIDYPGTVSTVLFYAGCNLACPYCHNPGFARPDSRSALVEPEQIRAFLRRRHGIIGGVVLSGGEPTIQAGLCATVREIRDLGYTVKLDTNGLLPDVIVKTAPDYLALDVKTAFSRYPHAVGASVSGIAQRLRKSIGLVRSMGSQAEVRITVAPGVIDMDAVEEVAGELKGVSRVYLQPMQTNGELLDPSRLIGDMPGTEDIEAFRVRIAAVTGQCLVRAGSYRPAAAAAA